MTESNSDVEVSGVDVSYRSGFRYSRVLRELSMRAESGCVTAVIAPNGAGKTTLFRTILGFQKAERGTCTIAGMAPQAYRRRFGVGYVPHQVGFPRGWTVGEVLRAGVESVFEPEEWKATFERVSEGAGFDRNTRRTRASRCSEGIRRRLLIAFAMIGDPSVMVLDEPFTGLDPEARARLRDRIRTWKSDGLTVLLSSHDLNEVAMLADRVYLMRRGAAFPLSDGGRAAGLSRDGLESWMMERRPRP